MDNYDYLYYIGGGLLTVLCVVVWMVARHQRSLRRRAELMLEAIRNHDFTFRLPTNGLLAGERAMQETLNQLGSTIRQQMNQNEVESWERLTRVLTHEIMNAMAPIVSISQSMLARDDVKGTALEEGIHAIHATSAHLTSFVDSYRKLSSLQKPQSEKVILEKAVGDVSQLYPQLKWDINLPSDFSVETDPTMLQQVLVNLTKNAVEANAQRMEVHLQPIATDQASKQTTILISNDGKPVPAEARSSVFVPFFTTKPTGNGIGLSLCRRMMASQNGWLDLDDTPRSGYHTTFRLTLAN